jgi:2-polyprenyl-6-methoxyphenol hydroxylase-like FAD-dependent oxidoreductase
MKPVHDHHDRMVSFPLNKLGQTLVEHINKHPSATIHWSHEVIGIEQDENVAKVICKTPKGDVAMEGTYLVGCDGANSKVRRALFGDSNSPARLGMSKLSQQT